MLITLFRFLKGYLVVKAEGKGTEKFMNLSIIRGINFWDVRKIREGFIFKTPVQNFKKLRPLVRQTGSKLKIQHKAGLPFFFQRTKRRKGIALGIIVFVCALYMFSSFIWLIEVRGLEDINEKEILKITREMGITTGTYKGGLELDKLGKELARLHGDVAWASFRTKGVLLEIEIAEHIPRPKMEQKPSNLVATKDGLILKTTVVDGTPVVSPGDVVSRGDVLIKGIKEYDEEFLQEVEDFKPEKIRARGDVEARVWYEARKDVEKKKISKKPTGNQQSTVYLLWNSQKIHLWGSDKIPFTQYTRETFKRKWSWRNLQLPVEFITITFNELEVEEIEFTQEEALKRAKKLAQKAVLSQVPPEAEKKRLFFEEKRDKKNWEIRAVVETRENIAGYP